MSKTNTNYRKKVVGYNRCAVFQTYINPVLAGLLARIGVVA
jgi:hypothetical protein